MFADIHRLVLDLKTAPVTKCFSAVTIIIQMIGLIILYEGHTLIENYFWVSYVTDKNFNVDVTDVDNFLTMLIFLKLQDMVN